MKERKSIRIFKEDPITKDTITELLEAGRLAPSGDCSGSFLLSGSRPKARASSKAR
ncbi:nitroreductase family protein [Natranaerofaba carboxydovora]|uniref:nitroreductase family protein n=1 Tax=Natranaerofaba carboxydovora TaxID=2742683 RepID=UPI003B84A171